MEQAGPGTAGAVWTSFFFFRDRPEQYEHALRRLPRDQLERRRGTFQEHGRRSHVERGEFRAAGRTGLPDEPCARECAGDRAGTWAASRRGCPASNADTAGDVVRGDRCECVVRRRIVSEHGWGGELERGELRPAGLSLHQRGGGGPAESEHTVRCGKLRSLPKHGWRGELDEGRQLSTCGTWRSIRWIREVSMR